MKMNPWTLSVLLLLAGPLGADPDWHVEYPDSFCVVEGSTATIPCSFTHPAVHRRTSVVVERVVWCPDHKICHNPTPNVYDSSNLRADSRFQYLGDLAGNCTLKIIKTVKRDAATYRFRFVTKGDKYTGPRGVRVNVTDGEDVKVRSSVTDHVVKEGGQVTLTCTSACSFHQLDVLWYRNSHALLETGPALHLSSLTNNNAGDYTCSLDSSGQNTSAPWCLLVLVDEDGEFVKVRSSVTDHVVKEGGQVTLTCTSACSFHQLDVHWYRNGHALSEKGPALHLSNLTNDNAGDYTCSLDSSGQNTSAPWSLVVLEDEDGEDVKVRSSVTDHVVKEGGQVTLTCTSACSFHQLDVHWYRNGHALSEAGPALHLSSLTNNNTGNYTCSLDSSGQKTSAPWSLVVMEKKSGWRVTVPVVLVLLAVVLLLLAGLVFAKRRCTVNRKRWELQRKSAIQLSTSNAIPRGQPLDRNMRSSTARSFAEPNSSSDSSSSSSDDEIREH
ncbi:sialoadhesin-like isoform X2 [Gadus macrocephalus]|uniref:sialoadhesin-like isoform X2 n=1 Tax=Gadus macrocephalus TaxID=80720 RepID=UPI0028CB17E6|nr:sialoadhesin-like isoform X2 [Gadus macrocephalus]